MSVNGYRVTISENRHLHRVPDLLVRLCINFESNPMLSLYRPLSRPDPTYESYGMSFGAGQTEIKRLDIDIQMFLIRINTPIKNF